MLRLLAFFLLLVPAAPWVRAQAVNNLQLDHAYDPLAQVILQMDPLMRSDSLEVHFRMKTTQASASAYLVKWERRDSYAQRQGATVSGPDTVTLTQDWKNGRFTFAKPAKPWLLVVKVTHVATGKFWYFFRQIEAHYPVNGYLERDGQKQWDAFVQAEYTYRLTGGSGKPVYISYYRDNFPTPAPPFVVKELKMDRFLFPDSTFVMPAGAKIGPFSREGLYLAQEDTTSGQGFSFFVKRAPYPKYNKLADLKGPLLFVTTQQENDALGNAGEDKAKFDRIILDITGDKERARTFMRNYFRRVELANYYFTSFKEGWKTDRGMIFTVFGRPDEVHFDGGFEEWVYKNPRQSFRFARAGSVYHPDHSMLVREKGYTEYWYMTIDLWRKSRF